MRRAPCVRVGRDDPTEGRGDDGGGGDGLNLAGAAPARADAGRSLYVYWVSRVAATSGLLFGFDIAVINGAILLLKQQLGLSEFQTEIAASSLLAGCVAGSALGGWLSDRLGRRDLLKLCALLFAVSSIGAAVPRTLEEIEQFWKRGPS